MSAKDAPGEVNNKEIFDSPNITSSEDDVIPELDEAAEEQKKRETVELDGVPIDEKDIKYKAEDIRKKKKINYFVNVEGAEERAKAAAKREEEEKREAEKKADVVKKAVEKAEHDKQVAENKKNAEHQKHLEEVKAYVKKQNAEQAREAKKSEKGETNRLKAIFVDGWHKFATLGAVIAIIVVAICITTSIIRQDGGEEQDDGKGDANPEYVAAYDNVHEEDIERLFRNYEFNKIEHHYEALVDGLNDNGDKAHLYLDEANRILNATEDENERVTRILELAYSYAPKDLSVVMGVANMFNMMGYEEKFQEYQSLAESLFSEQVEDDPDADDASEGGMYE